MIAKISVTTRCNAKCITCPVWALPGMDMRLEDFKTIFDKLNSSPSVQRIMLNNTGDLYIHPDHVEILKYVEEHRKNIPIIMTTNAAAMDYIPAIDCLVISFNGYDKESYERTTGLDFQKVSENIRNHYKDFFEKLRGRGLELNTLFFGDFENHEDDLLETWKDFPGHIRVSYKYDNQQREDRTIDKYKRVDRIPCDYIGMLNIQPDGRVIQCAHDFERVSDFGNILMESVEKLAWNKNRIMKKMEHDNLVFSGICERCNYNTPVGDRVRFLR